MNANRRKSPRYEINCETKVICENLSTGQSFDLVTSNISKGGVFIQGDKPDYPFRRGFGLGVTLFLDEKQTLSVRFKGKIVHEKNRNGFGIKITEIEAYDQKNLEAFIEKISESTLPDPEN